MPYPRNNNESYNYGQQTVQLSIFSLDSKLTNCVPLSCQKVKILIK